MAMKKKKKKKKAAKKEAKFKPVASDSRPTFDFARRQRGVSPERLDESPAALLLALVWRSLPRHSWRAMPSPSNT